MSNYLNILFIMRKVSIPDQILQELADELVKVTGAKVSYKSRVVMCIKGGNHLLPFDVLSQAKDKFGDILKDYSILWIADAQETDDQTDVNAGNTLAVHLDEVGHDEIQGEIANKQSNALGDNTSANTQDEDKPKCVILLDGPAILTILLSRRFGGGSTTRMSSLSWAWGLSARKRLRLGRKSLRRGMMVLMKILRGRIF